MKHTITLHLYERNGKWNDGTKSADELDYRDFPECMTDRIWVGEVDVEIEWPEVDTTQLQIDQLESQITRERADSQVRVNLLLDRISKLKCLEHKQ